MRRPLVIYDLALLPIPLNFLMYEEHFIFFFISVMFLLDVFRDNVLVHNAWDMVADLLYDDFFSMGSCLSSSSRTTPRAPRSGPRAPFEGLFRAWDPQLGSGWGCAWLRSLVTPSTGSRLRTSRGYSLVVKVFYIVHILSTNLIHVLYLCVLSARQTWRMEAHQNNRITQRRTGTKEMSTFTKCLLTMRYAN